MPTYTYTAIDGNTGQSTAGRIEAENVREAKERIRSQGQLPTQLTPYQEPFQLRQLLSKLPLLNTLTRTTIPIKEVSLLTEQLYALLEAGISLIEGLFILEQQSQNSRIKSCLKQVRSDVMAGDTMSHALSRFPDVFSRLYVNMIQAGEVGGDLDRICARLAALLEKQLIIRGKVQSALLMPAITTVVILGVVILLLVVVVPQFQNMFASYGSALPMPTQILITASQVFQQYWWIMGIGTLGFLAWFNTFRQGVGKPLIDRWLISTPYLGDLLKKSYASLFVRTLASLVQSGVPLTDGLNTAAATVDNVVLRHAFDKARESILMGGSLAKPLEQSNVFPLMVVKMIAVGEESGKLEAMLLKAADFLDREVDAAVNALTEMIKPAMTIILGGILLFVALSLYLPLWDMDKIMLNGG